MKPVWARAAIRVREVHLIDADGSTAGMARVNKMGRQSKNEYES